MTDDPVSVTVERNLAVVDANIQGFVARFNELQGFIARSRF